MTTPARPPRRRFPRTPTTVRGMRDWRQLSNAEKAAINHALYGPKPLPQRPQGTQLELRRQQKENHQP